MSNRRVASHLMDTNVLKQLTDARQDYRAAKTSRFRSPLTGVDVMGSGADYHYRSEMEWLRMIEQARQYDRDDLIVGAAINKLVANILQEGFNVDPNTGDTGVDEELRLRWHDWESDPSACHSEGEHDFREIVRLSLRSTFIDGDHFLLGLRGGPLQNIEAHRVRTPSNTQRDVIHGILLDKKARRRQVWITKENLSPQRRLSRVADIMPYNVHDADGHRQVFQTYLPNRTSQRRGVSAFAPIMDAVGMQDDIQFAMLVKQELGALIAILRETPLESIMAESTPLGVTELESTYNVKELTGVNAGLEVTSDPGEKLSAFSPNIPGPSYFEHVSLLLTLISVNLDLPMHVMLLDPTKTNFSGWRGAIEQARIRMREIQRSLIARLHKPVYEWKVRQWLAQDIALQRAIARSGLNPLRHRWNAPGWSYIEPKKDAEADAYIASRTLNSPRRIQAARGRDWDDVYRESIDDVASAIAYANDVANQLTSAGIPNVDWMTLYLPPAQADATQFNVGTQAASEDESSAEPPA